ncbi:hypothetical protein SKAU_G00364220 [Synaphobranchus kaupii]|uniref:Uncharacterized protein n=1 Tax=Synaphobranchus kaupii TaxID=118154 RepID=A0A9Q1IFB6_SYNKA|nr:hypothetical protein SKAU_G00364220 [Synaphobranchus kaupii]
MRGASVAISNCDGLVTCQWRVSFRRPCHGPLCHGNRADAPWRAGSAAMEEERRVGMVSECRKNAVGTPWKPFNHKHVETGEESRER